MNVTGILASRLRLVSGLVMFAYAATHLLNHALGIISLAAMEEGRILFLAVWRSLPGTVVLVASLIVHVGLALAKLYRRRNLRLPAWEATQIVLGLAIPLLLARHVLGTRFVHELFGADDTYGYVLLALWPDGALRQTALVGLVWLHGCVGIHFWLRLKPWYGRAAPFLLAVAILLPTLALIGFADAGREIQALATDRAWLADYIRQIKLPIEPARAFVYGTEVAVTWWIAAVLAGLVLLRGVRRLWIRRHRIQITYPGDRVVSVPPGTSVLGASRQSGIPHVSVCGGRGRCSTCRVRIGRGRENLPPPDASEQRVLDRIGAPENVRLACQLRLSNDVEVTPLLTAADGRIVARPDPGYRAGAEREIAILFADLRAFTSLSEHRLPYDVVFLLNQYFRAMGEAIEASGGRVDKFIGDGIMALFGIRTGPETGCRNALVAVRAMAEKLEELNRSLGHELPQALRIGIGLHAGSVIVGEMGYGSATSLTAIGDPVNVASRLEQMTKEFNCQTIISRRVAEHAGIDLSRFSTQEVEIRGRDRPLAVYTVDDSRDLPVETIAARAAAS